MGGSSPYSGVEALVSYMYLLFWGHGVRVFQPNLAPETRGKTATWWWKQNKFALRSYL